MMFTDILTIASLLLAGWAYIAEDVESAILATFFAILVQLIALKQEQKDK